MRWAPESLKPLKPSSALDAVARMPAPDIGPRLIDTSVWIRADRKGHDALKDRLRELLIAGSVWICWPIRAELLIGVKTPERWAIINEQLAALEQASISTRHGSVQPAWAISLQEKAKAFRCQTS